MGIVFFLEKEKEKLDVIEELDIIQQFKILSWISSL
jgi:hypothetical protein